jgi:hypothetical protein
MPVHASNGVGAVLNTPRAMLLVGGIPKEPEPNKTCLHTQVVDTRQLARRCGGEQLDREHVRTQIKLPPQPSHLDSV